MSWQISFQPGEVVQHFDAVMDGLVEVTTGPMSQLFWKVNEIDQISGVCLKTSRYLRPNRLKRIKSCTGGGLRRISEGMDAELMNSVAGFVKNARIPLFWFC